MSYQPPPGNYPPQYQQPQQGYAPQQQQQHAHGSSPVQMTPHTQEALGQVDLLPGEQIVYTLQADGFFLGANPFLKMMASIQAFFTTITGGHIRIFLAVTNQRVLVLKSIQFMCGCQRVKSVHAIALSGLKETGSSKDTQMCCVNTRTVSLQSMTQNWQLVLKKASDQEIRSFVTNLSSVMVAHSNRASV